MPEDTDARVELERLLDSLDAADTALRGFYLKLADNPDLALEYEAGLRELHSRRSELARDAGLAALSARRAAVAVDEPVAVESPPPAAPTPPTAPVSARQLADFMAGMNAPARPARPARPDDRTALLSLAAHVTVAKEIATSGALESEVAQLERASSEDRMKRWREMSREAQVRWLSLLVAWAKALEQDAARLGESALAVSAVFRDLRTFSMNDNPGFVHGFARTASPKGASWRADALRVLREIRPEAEKVVAPARAAKVEAADDEGEELEAVEAEPLGDWPYLDRVKGLRVVLLGGEVREERRVVLERAFQLAELEWIPRDRPRLVASLAERAAQGTVDIILVTKFVAHKETQAIARSTKAPILTMRHGYGVAMVRQVLEEHFARMDAKGTA